MLISAPCADRLFSPLCSLFLQLFHSDLACEWLLFPLGAAWHVCVYVYRDDDAADVFAFYTLRRFPIVLVYSFRVFFCMSGVLIFLFLLSTVHAFIDSAVAPRNT